VPRATSRVVEAFVPARLGRSFRLLLASALITNAGDGVALAAGPLLIATLTRDPLLVSMAVLAGSLPKLLFGVVSGGLADRVDRRRVASLVNIGRAIVLAVLAVTIATHAVSIAIVLAALFVEATAETFANVSESSLLPRLVERRDLGIANARLQGAFLLLNQLVGPPIGAFLFAIGMALPFAADAICYAFGAILITRVVYSREPKRDGAETSDAPRQSFRKDLADGLRWLAQNAPMRTLVLTIVAFNITFGAAWGVLVLYAQERLGMNEVGFGLLTTAMAIGGIIGVASYGRLERRFSLADIMRVGLCIETVTHLVLAISTQSVVVLGMFVVFGGHAFVWGTTSTAVRQRAVPDELLGRVTGAYSMAIQLGIVIGTPIGGLLARQFGITAPFWFGFVGSALLVTVLWREFDNIVHAGDSVPHRTPAD
jgi:predicted MFS family arabinose efflux permease